MKITRSIWICAIAVLISIPFYLSINSLQTKTAATDEVAEENIDPLVIGYSNWSGWWPWAIAESEGLFAKRGINVELKWYDNYTQSLEDLAAGYIDGNCQTLSDTITFANESVKGETVVLVNDNSAGNDKIIVASDIDSIADLKGKQIAVEAGVVDDFLLMLALERSGLTRKDVNILDLETGAATAAFTSGQVDAVGAFPPFWLTAFSRSGAKEIVSSAAFPGAIPDLLVVTQEIARKKPEQVQRLVECWFDILRFMKQYPEKSDKIMAQRAEVSDREFQLFKAGTKMFSLKDNLNAFERRRDMTSLYYAAEEIERFLNQNFFNKHIELNSQSIFTPKFIRSIDRN